MTFIALIALIALIVLRGLLTALALYVMFLVLRSCRERLLLTRAKHPSLQGHARWAARLARLVPFYDYDESRFFDCDGAPSSVAAQRRAGFDRLAASFRTEASASAAVAAALESSVSDLHFTNHHRVPFQFSRYAAQRLKVDTLVQSSEGVTVTDVDGRTHYDLTGSYGVNLFGYDFYKSCIDVGVWHVRALGPVLGSYHPLVADNVRKLKAISGLDEVSFHMSGTEAVMQAVRLARFHTGRAKIVRFCGAYHGWWDDVQPGLGNPSAVRDTYTLKDMDADSLRVLEARRDVACVLVNPVQALHANAGAPADSTLIASDRAASFDRGAYTAWLQALRDVCTRRGIVLIFDEVFVGFRIAYGGAQEYFGVRADLVTYGKTLGGGLPIGVVCGRARYMKRFRDDRPLEFCFARGTFNSHPYVMGAMHEFLRRLDEPEFRGSYAGLDEAWNARACELNARLERERIPVKVVNLVSIWVVCYTAPSRYNWMFQYYLRAEGLLLSWIGSGRLIFSHNYTNEDVAVVFDRCLAAARAMRDDGWWWQAPALTNQAIRRQVLRETIAARLPWVKESGGDAAHAASSLGATAHAASSLGATAHAASSDTIGSNSSPRMT
jgi:glutamate-1-semialdehyde 2,1-aminomutase